MQTIPIRHRLAWLTALLALVALTACGGDQPDSATPGPTTADPTGSPEASPNGTPSPTPSVEVELVQVEVSGGEVDPPPGRVEVDRGERVRVVVTSDQPDTVHLHGYDLEADVGPGAEGVIEFTADQSGLFELETHDSGLVLTQLLVR